MREKTLEQYLVRRAAAFGGMALKLVCPGTDGLADRLVLLPRGRVGFLELKVPGERPNALQAFWLRALSKLGFVADWADSQVGVDAFLERLRADV